MESCRQKRERADFLHWLKNVSMELEQKPFVAPPSDSYLWYQNLMMMQKLVGDDWTRARRGYAVAAGLCAGHPEYRKLESLYSEQDMLTRPVTAEPAENGRRFTLEPDAFPVQTVRLAVAVSDGAHAAAPEQLTLLRPAGAVDYRSPAFGSFGEQKHAALLAPEAAQPGTDGKPGFFLPCVAGEAVEIAAVYDRYIEVLWRSSEADVRWPERGLAPVLLTPPDAAEKPELHTLGEGVCLRTRDFQICPLTVLPDVDQCLLVKDLVTGGELLVTIQGPARTGFSGQVTPQELLAFKGVSAQTRCRIQQTPTVTWTEYLDIRSPLMDFDSVAYCGGLTIWAMSSGPMRTHRHFFSELVMIEQQGTST